MKHLIFLLAAGSCLLACAGGEIAPLPSPGDTAGADDGLDLKGTAADEGDDGGVMGGTVDSGSPLPSSDGGGDDGVNEADVIESEDIEQQSPDLGSSDGGSSDDVTEDSDAGTSDGPLPLDVQSTDDTASTVDTGSSSDVGNGADTGTNLTLQAGQCMSGKDCSNFELCAAMDAPPMCGICFSPPTTCDGDASCKKDNADYICKSVICACSGEKECQAGCSVNPEQCKSWEVCDLSGHCSAMACAQAGDCLPAFECNAGSCARKSCKSNDDCSAWCVKGKCYSEPGKCMMPPP
ncbi:MAG TPA: hypothetical protein EYN66_06055 [Myxococcales bacterium]|nr:hypothetical protein [Myxococcales bacterium]